MKLNYILRSICCLCSLIFIVHGDVLGQCKQRVSAFVFSKKGEPIAYAAVYAKQNKSGNYTDLNGKFMVRHCEVDTLVISYMNYNKRFIPVDALSDGDTLFLEENKIKKPADILNSKVYQSKSLKPKGVKHFYLDIKGFMSLVYINEYWGSYLEEVSFYFGGKLEDSLYRLVLLPFSEDLTKEISMIDTVLYFKKNKKFSKKTTIDISNLGIQIPKNGLLIGFERVRDGNQLNFSYIETIKSSEYQAWFGRYSGYYGMPKSDSWNNSTLKFQYKVLVPKK